MMFDTSELPNGQALRSQICIIGAGAAGITLALELIDSGIDVLLLESGGRDAEDEVQALYAGSVADTRLHSPPDRYRQRRFGGTTTIWGGRCMPFDPIDFEARDYLPHSGWPIDYDTLAPFYPRANQLCEAGRFAYRTGEAFSRPLRPMLAQTAATATEALARLGGRAGVEEKLDGARVQVHRQGDTVRLYSRRLQEMTPSLPDVVTHLLDGLAVPAAILEGEVLPVDDAGRPLPFQELMRRFRRVKDVSRLVREVPVTLRLFDALQVGETPLIDRPYEERWAALEGARGGVASVARTVAASDDDAERFLAGVLAAGHEGVMVKDLAAPYTPGIRGGAWLKVKRVVSVDLAIVAADRGYGRRRGWLSNYHLAARDEQTGTLEPVGKTFKGLTDTEFERMTERLSRRAIREEGGTVFVEPEVVVEVLFSDLQRSPTYRAGLALRFARILRVRDDKTVAEVDTVAHLRALLAAQEAHRGPAS